MSPHYITDYGTRGFQRNYHAQVGTIVIHAGMAKAGSTSVQKWLRHNSATLRRVHGIDLAVVRMRKHDLVELRPHRHGTPNSGAVVDRMTAADGDEGAIAASFANALVQRAERHRVVVVTSESLSRVFFGENRPLLDALERAAAAHAVRVAYYVRPQDTSIEAAWRQWGFATGVSPSVYVRRRARHLDYLGTHERVAVRAPSVEFVPRPFRNDLLDGANVVVDFARRFLGLEDVTPPEDDAWANRGLPLEVANALRDAPAGVLPPSVQRNDTVDALKSLVASLDAEETEATRLSRRILQQWCFERFEADNLALAERLAWDIGSFVPPVADAVDADIGRLDELWRSAASPAELAFLHALVGRHLRSVRNGSRLRRGVRSARAWVSDRSPL